MSLRAAPATVAEPAIQQGADATWPLVIIVWLAVCAGYVVPALRAPFDGLSTDDAMRLVMVRDLLAGQAWFDHTQHRVAPPDGVLMHWSRLIDLPLALMIRAGEFVADREAAERIVVVVWPLAMLLPFLAGVATLARDLGGPPAARLALILAALTALVLQHFRPGAIDHHNVQLVALVWLVALTAREPWSRPAAAASGLLAAISLAIGLEMLPAIAALAGVAALGWIVRGAEVKPGLAAFGLAFAAGTLALAIATVPPARYGVAGCDSLSIVHVVAAALGGLGISALVQLRLLDTPARRLGSAALLGAVVMAMVVALFPDCLRDPYAALDPRLTALWLNQVSEARNVLSLARDLPQEVPAIYGLALAALALGAVHCVHGDGAGRWLVAIAVLAILTGAACWQIRAAAAANSIAVPLLAAALVRCFPARLGQAGLLGLSRPVLLAALVLNPLSLLALGEGGARLTPTERPTVLAGGPGTCQRGADFAPLNGLPRGLVLSFIDSGPFVLMATPHSVLAAPYHRNGAGNAAMLDALLSGPAQAKIALAAKGVDYVAFCAGAPERFTYAAAAPDGLAASLGRGEIPEFLVPLALRDAAVAVYQVRR